MAGRAQFGIASATHVIQSVDEGLPVVAIAVVFRRNPLVLVSRKELGIRRPADLEGRVIRASPDMNSDAAAIFNQFGLSVSDYTLVNEPVQVDITGPSPVDVWLTYVPTGLIQAENQKIPINAIFPDEFRVHIPGDTIVARRDFVEANPVLTRGLPEGVVRRLEIRHQPHRRSRPDDRQDQARNRRWKRGNPSSP